MMRLDDVQAKLDTFFELDKLDKDPAFSRFVPTVYDLIHVDWKKQFEPLFSERFNGLMIRGSHEVGAIFLAVFPTDEVLGNFLDEAEKGDLLFMHHPIPMECGDPRGDWGRGFIPVQAEWIERIKEKKLSVYTCHAPLDYNRIIGTSDAIAEGLEARVVDEFCQYGIGNAGLICELPLTNTSALIEQLKLLLEIPYVDFEGVEHTDIDRVAVIAGCGDLVADMKIAESKGAKAYITGEIHCHIDNDYGRHKYRLIKDYARETGMSLIGLSHAASEFYVMKTQMKRWLNDEFDVHVKLLRQSKWWV